MNRFDLYLVATGVALSLQAAPASYGLSDADANGDIPVAAETIVPETGEPLVLGERRFSPEGFFEVFHNLPATDAVEGVSAADALRAGGFLDCAWLLFTGSTDLAMGDFPFKNPLGSLHLGNQQRMNIPVWVRGRDSENGGASTPRISISPVGALFGCSACDPDGLPPTFYGYDPVAFHEFGHVIFKSYSYFLNSGPVGFLNEGLPSGVAEVPLNPYYVPPARPMKFDDEHSLRDHLDLSDQTLRNYSYPGSPFWYFLVMRYSDIPDTDGFYPEGRVPDRCVSYADAIWPTGLRMRKMPGRDVIRHLQQEFELCHPLGLRDTPRCKDASGTTDVLEARCATWSGEPEPVVIEDPGCVPQDEPGGWKSFWARSWDPLDREGQSKQSFERVGEVLMPLVLTSVDNALEKTHGLEPDGVPYLAFREFLVENYRNGPANEVWPGTSAGQFRVKAFGAHYHEISLVSGQVNVRITNVADLPRAAYGVFYVDDAFLDGDQKDDPAFAVTWRELPAGESDRFVVYPDVEQAVLVVTAFEGTYDPFVSGGLFVDSGGQYRLDTEYVTFDADVFDDEDADTPAPGGWPTDRNDSRATRTEIAMPDDPDKVRSRIHYDDLTLDSRRDRDFFRVALPNDSSGGCVCQCNLKAFCSKRLTITVNGDHEPVDLLLSVGGYPIDPGDHDWVRWAGSALQVEIPCPWEQEVQLPNGQSTPLLMSGEAIVFFVERADRLTSYDLDVTYEYRTCEMPPFSSQVEEFAAIFDARNWRREDVVFPTDQAVYLDCESDPLCDPAEEFSAIAWDGGDFRMDFVFASENDHAPFAARLLNPAGEVLGVAQPPGELPRTAVPSEERSLFIRELKSGWYFLGVDAAFPTRYAHQVGVSDVDRDLVPDLFDNCEDIPNAAQPDHDGDGLGDACDNCANRANPEQADVDRDGSASPRGLMLAAYLPTDVSEGNERSTPRGA